jgi:hypothetical protein
VSSGGTASNTTIISGHDFVLSGATDSATTVSSGGLETGRQH